MSKPAWLERLEFYEAQGFAEVPGPKSNPKIVAWMQGPGRGAWVKNDAVPWCGGCMAGMMAESNLSHIIPQDPLGAINWLNLPTKLDDPRVGAIVVFKRPGGHHVTCVKSFDDRYLYCIGGNQGDAIKTSRFARTGPNGPLGYRWPVALPTPSELAQTSRIAAAAQRQQGDAAKAGGSGATAPLPMPAPPPKGSVQGAVDNLFGDMSWAKSAAMSLMDFFGFVGAVWPWIAVTVALYFGARMAWDSHLIKTWRTEDAHQGWTT